MSLNPAVKSINLDWLEVFCIERIPMNAQYFQALGWKVNVREYGTPLYKEMFTLLNEHGKPFLEIRRNPYSLKKNGGIFEDGACHIRLSNRTLYTNNPVNQLQNFLDKYGYYLKGITRIDIACDQIVFDNGMNPQDLINKYMSGEILKNRNSRINAHGSECKNGKVWNSLKWGSTSSPLSTKIYDKTLELSQQSDKLYIKDMWVKDGLCDLQKVSYDFVDKKTKEKSKRAKMVVVEAGTKTDKEQTIEECHPIKIWRVEFSLKSEAKHWISIDGSLNLNMSLIKFLTKKRCMYVFLLLSKWCMNFVYAEYNTDGSLRRKDRSTPILLYSDRNLEKTFKPQRIVEKEDPSRMDKILLNKLIYIADSDKYMVDDETKVMCKNLAKKLQNRHGNFYLTDEQLKKIDDINNELQNYKDEKTLYRDTFQSLGWIEKWKANSLTNYEKYIVRRYKGKYVLYFINQAKEIIETSQKKIKWAQKELDFWQGKTMPEDIKKIVLS